MGKTDFKNRLDSMIFAKYFTATRAQIMNMNLGVFRQYEKERYMKDKSILRKIKNWIFLFYCGVSKHRDEI